MRRGARGLLILPTKPKFGSAAIRTNRIGHKDFAGGVVAVFPHLAAIDVAIYADHFHRCFLQCSSLPHQFAVDADQSADLQAVADASEVLARAWGVTLEHAADVKLFAPTDDRYRHNARRQP